MHRATRRGPAPIEPRGAVRPTARGAAGRVRQSVPAEDPAAIEAARLAGLHYVTSEGDGITRERLTPGDPIEKIPPTFRYRDAAGKVIADEELLARIRRLAIPPAWEQVWICPDPRGHLQATGRDVRGRKQYRYHPHWRLVRDENKFERMLEFGSALPSIRARIERDMQGQELSRERVLAAIVRLLDRTLIRVGNEEYARENGSFGLTTLRRRHLSVEGKEITFSFRGKSGVEHSISVKDARAARIVTHCAELPGQVLFKYVADDSTPRVVGSSDVNAYLREISGSNFTAKDFRTWAATVLAGFVLAEMDVAEKVSEQRKNVVAAMREVADRLGNTPTICRKSYVHPAIVDAYLEGTQLSFKKQRRATKYMNPSEHAVLSFLRDLARRQRRKSKRTLKDVLAKSVSIAKRRKTA